MQVNESLAVSRHSVNLAGCQKVCFACTGGAQRPVGVQLKLFCNVSLSDGGVEKNHSHICELVPGQVKLSDGSQRAVSSIAGHFLHANNIGNAVVSKAKFANLGPTRHHVG